MRQIKAVLFALFMTAVIGALTTTPARRSQASEHPNNNPHQQYLPDLIVSQVVPVYIGERSQGGGTLVPDEVWVKVTNKGDGAAGAFKCVFQWDKGYDNEQEFFFVQGGLGAGKSIWLKASAKGYNLWAANHHFRFTVNVGNAIAETDTTNNTYNSP
jgi:hypothetical protein